MKQSSNTIVVVTLALVGFTTATHNLAVPSEVDPQEKLGEDLSKSKAAFSLIAADFAKEFNADSNGAKIKYKDKVIELSGVVKSFGFDESHFVLEGTVVCAMADPTASTKVVPGQKVKVKGKFHDQAVVPTLLSSVFVETGSYEGIAISAEQLGKEIAADRATTEKKYDGKWLILTGEVVEKKKSASGGATEVFLKTDKVAIFCSFGANQDLAENMKAGQQITVIGQYSQGNAPPQHALYDCVLPKKK
jgi:hypothetical protein